MKHVLILVGSLILALPVFQERQPPLPNVVLPTGPQKVELNGHVFTLPQGFTIELVAGPPLVERPIMADFDEEGRLYVAESSGTNDPVQQQLQKKPHSILRLEDTNGDGVFDKRTVFADKMMFPEGVLWYDGSLYVAAPPSIWKLTDTNNDGVADQRVEWFQGKTLTGCANDLHGPYLGPDGWIYWCKGAFARQTYDRPGKPPFTTRAAHIFRARPDGTGLEAVMTGGMDNPVELVFTPGGERIFTTTFLQHPGGGKRDGLLHAVYGGIYGKDHDPIYEHRWTGPKLMPVMTHLGAAAPSGLCRYESQVFGSEYQDNLFAALFNLHKITRHVLIPDGATFRTKDEDFLVSNNLDFHPTDVLEDADGSLLVIDTGGWYKLCCPTSQLHKPDVLGAIYRIRKVGAAKVEDPRGKRWPWKQLSPKSLATMLDDPCPAVQKRAISMLAKRGPEVVSVLEEVLKSSSPLAARNAVWTATRISGQEARDFVRDASRHSDDIVKQVALHSIGLWRDKEEISAVFTYLFRDSLQNRRVAAETLGRLGDEKTMPGLLYVVGQTTDPVCEHSLIYALIEIGQPKMIRWGLGKHTPRIRRAALIALSEMANGGLQPDEVVKELSATDPRLKEAAWWILGRHPEWSQDLAPLLRERFSNAAEHEELLRQLPRLAGSPAMQAMLAERLQDSSKEVRLLVLRIMAHAGLKTVPPSWVEGVRKLLIAADQEMLPQALITIRSWRLKKDQWTVLTPLLLKIGRQENQPAPVRLQALAALPNGMTEIAPTLFVWLCQQAQSEQPGAIRGLATDTLSRAKLSSEQLLELTNVVSKLGPMEMERVLTTFTQTKEEKVGLQLVAALKTASSLSALRSETVRVILEKYGPRVQKEAESLYVLLDVNLSEQRAHLERLLTTLPPGDIRRGQAVFQSQKAVCISCHSIGYLGGKVGPDLTHIGRIRTDRDLLESIVYPNASFVRSYEPVVVLTKEGKIHNGILRKEPEEIILAVSADQEVRLSRDEIEEMTPGKVSLMPSGLEQQLTVQELADVVAFLKACK